jgi:hypothetical protein
MEPSNGHNKIGGGDGEASGDKEAAGVGGDHLEDERLETIRTFLGKGGITSKDQSQRSWPAARNCDPSSSLASPGFF